MTTAQALRTNAALRFVEAPSPQPSASPQSRLRLLHSAPSTGISKPAADGGGFDVRVLALKALPWLLVASIHVVFAVHVWNRKASHAHVAAPQQIELLSVERPPVPEPRHIEPPPPPPPVPKAAARPPAVQPAALRTQSAQAPQADTMQVAENLNAAPSTGPVVAATAPTPPAPPPAPHVEETVTEPTGYAGYLNNPSPAYPKAAQRLGMQGRVLLRVRVLASGQVGDIEIKQSSGKALLDEAALATVKGWSFAPAKKGNTPVDAWTQVPIEFKLAQ